MMHSHRLNGAHSRYVMLGYHTVLPHPVKVFAEKAPPPTGMVELLEKQIKALTSHCDLFQWLKKDSYPLEVNAHWSRFISQRSGWIMFQIRATCAIGAMGASL